MQETGKSNGKVAAFFDIDGTIIRGATSWYLVRELYGRGFFGWRDVVFGARQAFFYILFGEQNERIEKVRQRGLQMMKGHSEAEFTLLGEELYHRTLEERIFPGTGRLINRHLKAGHEVWFVSAAPELVAKQMARSLGATGALGTVVDIDENGIVAGTMPGGLLHGAAKARAVRKLAIERNIDMRASYAYSDSWNDTQLLRSVGNPAAVNPDRKLRELAQKRSWPIFHFSLRPPTQAIGARRKLIKAEMMGFLWVLSIIEEMRIVRFAENIRRKLGLDK